MFDSLKEFFRPDTVNYFILIIVFYVLLYVAGTKISHMIIDMISKRLDANALHWKFVKRAVQGVLIFIVIFGISSSLPVLDKFVTTLLASSTVLVAAIGLASQESMANIVSGMFISIFKPFAVGDRIKLSSNGLVGRIEDINLRHTVVRTIENNRIIVPNTTMNKEVVENSDYKDERICNFLDLKITYESDVQKARKIISEAILSHQDCIDWRSEEEKKNNVPRVNVMIRDISNNCVELRVGVWTVDINSSFRTCSDLRGNIMEKFREENIKLYYQTIRVDRHRAQ